MPHPPRYTGDQVLESAVAELVEDGEVQRHVRRMQRIYRARRDTMAALLTRELGGAVTVTPPVGGTAFWLRVAPDIDIDRWSGMAAMQDVIFEGGDRFFDGAPLPYVRVGFAGHRGRSLPRPSVGWPLRSPSLDVRRRRRLRGWLLRERTGK